MKSEVLPRGDPNVEVFQGHLQGVCEVLLLSSDCDGDIDFYFLFCLLTSS